MKVACHGWLWDLIAASHREIVCEENERKKSEKERDREKGGDVPPLAVLSGWPGIQGSGSLQVPLRPTPKQFPNGANDGD